MTRFTTLKTTVALFLSALCLGTVQVTAAKAAGQPDLTVPWIASKNYSTTTVFFNRPFTFYWSEAIIFVRNIGTAPSAPCHLRLEVRNWATQAVEHTFIVNIPAIAPGVTQDVEFIQSRNTFNFADPTTYMTGTVDCNFEVTESNENNNFGYSGLGGQGG